MNKIKKFNCPYCNKEFLRGSMGYTNHLKAHHPSIYFMGSQLYADKPSSKWPFIVVHPSTLSENNAARITQLVYGDATSDAELLRAVDNADNISHPPHYTAAPSGIECIDAIHAALSPEEFNGFLKGNVIKYNWRETHKGGLEDLKKARWYLERLIKQRELEEQEAREIKS